MKREIKFRAWDTEQKYMVTKDDLYGASTYQSKTQDEIYACSPLRLMDALDYMDGYVLMQFTGLLDKNGVEIYEGDILCWSKDENKTKRMTWFVEWTGRGWSQWSSTHDEAIIIGNIYENPELLENTK